jgi:MFS family permease
MLAQTTPATLVTRWFEQRRGMAMGLMIAGNGIGPFVFSSVVTWLIVRWDWRTAFVAISFVMTGFLVTAYLLMRNHPHEIGRIFWGFFADCHGARLTLMLTLFMQGAFMLWLVNSQDPVIFFLYALVWSLATAVWGRNTAWWRARSTARVCLVQAIRDKVASLWSTWRWVAFSAGICSKSPTATCRPGW